jgi:hypothetical protein
LLYIQRLQRRRLRLTIKDRIDVFHDVGIHIQEVAFVFDGDEGAFGAVVLDTRLPKA